MKDVNGRKLIGFNLACVSVLIVIMVYWYTKQLNEAAEAWNKRKSETLAKATDTLKFNPIIAHSKIKSIVKGTSANDAVNRGPLNN